MTAILVGTGLAENRWDWLTFPGREPEWELQDPSFLYLSFRHKGHIEEMLTWLHPMKGRHNLCWESWMRGHQQDSRAFAYQLVREAPDGYEVSFQPIDPITEQPLPLKDTTVLFSRSTRRLVTLTDKLSVVGFYGSPQLQRPWWLSHPDQAKRYTGKELPSKKDLEH